MTYVSEQRAALRAARFAKPVLAAVTFRQPLHLAEFRVFVEAAKLQAEYIEWQLPNAPDHGGAVWPLVAALEEDYPAAEVTYFSTVAPVSRLQALSGNSAIWLVDLGVGSPTEAGTPLVQGLPKNYFHNAQRLGIIDK
jgi:hypothetical protein